MEAELSKKEEIKRLYVDGKSVEEVCLACSITRATFYYHKKKSLKEGVNWELLRLQRHRGVEDIEEKEAVFLSTLIESFDRFIQSSKSEELSPSTVEALHKYATTYWKLKAPKEIDAKSLSMKVAEETLRKIGEMALEENNQEVSRFLAKNADRLIAEILKKR